MATHVNAHEGTTPQVSTDPTKAWNQSTGSGGVVDIKPERGGRSKIFHKPTAFISWSVMSGSAQTGTQRCTFLGDFLSFRGWIS